MTWHHAGTIQPIYQWVGVTVPDFADASVLRIFFSFHGNSLRVYSRIFVRQVYQAVEGEWVRGQPIRVYPDLNEQIISFPPISGGLLKFIEIKKGFRSWRWRHIKDAPHLIRVSFFVPE